MSAPISNDDVQNAPDSGEQNSGVQNSGIGADISQPSFYESPAYNPPPYKKSHFDINPPAYAPPIAPLIPYGESAAQMARVDISVISALCLIVLCVAGFAVFNNISLLLILLLPLQGLVALPLIISVLVDIRMRYKTSASATPKLLDDNELPIYSVVIPLYREANMLAQIATMLTSIDYPHDKLDVMILLEESDSETRDAAAAIHWAEFCRIMIVPEGNPRTKPRACNYALAQAKGQYLVIYDAEDKPHPLQLRAAASTFDGTPLPLACLQSPLTITENRGGYKWHHTQFAFEYRVLFNFVLPFLAKAQLAIPLGGTSNHFRTAILRALGGWDAYNLTEDADLGYRLVAGGYRTQILGYATTENAPQRLKDWFLQRTRWFSGHIQTWHVHMGTPRTTLQDMGAANIMVMNIMLAMRLLTGPAHCAFLFWGSYHIFTNDIVLYTPALIFMGIFYTSLCLAAFVLLKDYSLARRLWMVVSIPFYWILLTPPTLYACWRMARRDYRWLKSPHEPYAL